MNVTISPVQNSMVIFVQDLIMGYANAEYVSANQNGKMMIVTVQSLLIIALILMILLKIIRLVQEMDTVNVIIASALNPHIHQYNIMVDLIVN